MSNRLDKDREERLQPTRMEKAITEIENLGFKITYQDKVKINFWFKGSAVHFFPYSGWASGKHIKDGRGLENLLKQIRE